MIIRNVAGTTLAIMFALASYGCGPATDAAANSANAADDDGAENVSAATAPDRFPVPTFRRDFAPPAPGHGNFEICLSEDARDNGLERVTLPAASVFQSWGQLTGPLRASNSFDMNAAGGDNEAGSDYAVVTTQPVTMSPAHPCIVTVAKAVTHDGFNFTHETVPVELHLSFQTDGLFETQSGDISNEATKDDALSQAFGAGMINGTPWRTSAMSSGCTRRMTDQLGKRERGLS